MNIGAFLRERRHSASAPTLPARACATCAHFVTDVRTIESALPGLTSLSSGYAAVRGDDGYCETHQRLLGAASICADFQPRHPPKV